MAHPLLPEAGARIATAPLRGWSKRRHGLHYTRRDEREEIEMPDGTPATEPELEVLLSDEETFPPPPEFTAQANASDPAIYEQAESDPEGWWESWARQLD